MMIDNKIKRVAVCAIKKIEKEKENRLKTLNKELNEMKKKIEKKKQM